MQVLKNTFTCGARTLPEDGTEAYATPVAAQAGNDIGAQAAGNSRRAELQAAGTDDRVVQRARGVYYVVGQSPTCLSSLLGRCIIRAADEGNIKGVHRCPHATARMVCVCPVRHVCWEPASRIAQGGFQKRHGDYPTLRRLHNICPAHLMAHARGRPPRSWANILHVSYATLNMLHKLLYSNTA